MYEIIFFSYKNIHIFKQIFKNSISNVAKSVFYQGISVQIPQPTLNNTQKLQYIIAVMYNSFIMEVLTMTFPSLFTQIGVPPGLLDSNYVEYEMSFSLVEGKLAFGTTQSVSMT